MFLLWNLFGFVEVINYGSPTLSLVLAFTLLFLFLFPVLGFLFLAFLFSPPSWVVSGRSSVTEAGV